MVSFTKQRHIKFILIFVFAFWTMTAFASFAVANGKKQVSLQLPWKHQFQFAGFYAAKEKGFYAAEGLDVNLLVFKPGADLIDEVTYGRATYGIWDTEVIGAYLRGREIVFLANFFKHSPLVLAVKPGTYLPSELKGKKIMATPHEINGMNFKQMFMENGISQKDLKIVPHTFNIDPFVRGEIDAMTIYITNETYALNQQQVPYHIIDPGNYGIRLLAGNLFSSEKKFKKNPEQARAFTEASIKGWEYALAHPHEIIELILEKYTKRKTRKALEYEAREIRKIILPSVHPVGHIDKTAVKRLADLFLEFGLVKEKRDLDRLFTDEIFKKIRLTPAEQKYLQEKKTLTMCVDPYFMPFEQIDKKGNHIGLASDYIKLISKRIGIPIQLVPTKNWSQSLEIAKKGECDILSIMNPTPERKKIFNFSTPYLTTPLVTVAQNRMPYVNSLEDLAGKTLALVKGYAIEEQIKIHHKEIRVVHVEGVKEAMAQVSKGKADATIVSVIEAVYHIEHMGLANIKIAGDLNYDYALSSGFPKQETALKTIFNKAIRSLTEKEKEEIFDKWIAVRFDHKFDFALFWRMMAVIGFVCVVFGFFYWQSHRHNQQLRKLNRKLYNTREMLRLVIDNIPQFIFWKDQNSVYLGCNKNFSNIAGMADPDQIIGKTDADLTWDEKAPVNYKNTEKKIMETNTPVYHEIESRTLPGNTKIWLDISKIPLHDSSDRVVGILGTYENITQRKLTEFRIQQSEKKYRTILESIQDGYCEINTQGIITLVNTYTSVISGYETHELEGMHISQIIENDFGNKIPDILREKNLIHGNYLPDISFTIVRKDGSCKHVETSGSVIREMDGQISGLRSIVRDVDQRKLYEKELLHLAYHDSLTGLNNRKAFYEHLDQALKRADRYGHQVILFYLDIDRFKQVNDTLGHESGDTLLKKIACRLTALLRKTDIISRIGGDEFTVLVENCQKTSPNVVAEKMIKEIARPYALDSVQVDYVSASIGISCYPEDSRNINTLVRRADKAMYRAKKKGNRYLFHAINPLEP